MIAAIFFRSDIDFPRHAISQDWIALIGNGNEIAPGFDAEPCEGSQRETERCPDSSVAIPLRKVK